MLRVIVMSTPMMSSVIHNLGYTPPPDVSIGIFEAVLEKGVALAKQLEHSNDVDVFVAAGSSAKLLSRVVEKPLIEISVTGFDILYALKTAMHFSSSVAVFTYPEQIHHIAATLDVLAMQVKTIVYDYEQIPKLERAIDELLRLGIRTVIGPSLIVQLAQRRGMNAVFIYSNDSVKRALDQAVQVGKINLMEAERVKRFETILNFTYGGIIATDAGGNVTAFNPAAEKITGLDRKMALGKPIGKLFPNSKFVRIVHLKEPEINQIVSLGDRRIITNHVPILSEGILTGAVITFQDFAAIQDAEAEIRSKLFHKGFLVKTGLDDIHGRSPAILHAKDETRLFASSHATITILGETGTGKELFAQGIHRASPRAAHPFVAINCDAFPMTLLESELFGYDEGAFTGARRGGKKGLIELAHRGTLFLDEIAEMPIALQTRMLRVLEEREVIRIGGEKIINVDIRVIAATNKDLWALVCEKKFREDLYYRLNVLVLRVPPLRVRLDDIPILTSLFLSELLPDMPAKQVRSIANHSCLRQHSWPGNVRELKNLMERFAVLSPAFPDLFSLLDSLLQPQDRVGCKAAGEIVRVLCESGGSRRVAAERLGVSRSTLWRRIKRLKNFSPELCRRKSHL